jgi:hypothetical protein
MIASFSRRFVFLKTRKTAGTSVELALSSACGPEDIVTPISLEDEHLRVRDGVIGARNFADAEVMESYRTAVLTRNGDLHRAAMQRAKSEGFFNHMPAAKVASRLPPDFWRSAFKFSIVRHPYERAVSSAYFRLHQHGAPVSEFPKWLDRVCDNPGFDDSKIYSIDAESVVDDMIRFESLEDDLRRICSRLSVDLPDQIPRAKSTMRLDRRPAREVLSDRQKQKIFERCRDTFLAFGYEA